MKHLLLLLCAALAGCASYRPLTLPSEAALVGQASQLQVDVKRMPLAELATHPFNPADGLDMTEVAMLAVANSPELKAMRAAAGVTKAQAFSAGLLPDPQLALSRDAVLGSPPGSTVALSAGLAFDLSAFLARSSARAAADADVRKSNLNLFWQEWQTVAKARMLFVTVAALTQSQNLLDAQRQSVCSRLDAADHAMADGLITSDMRAPLLTACDDVGRQWRDGERQLSQARHDLNALLGVAPDLALTLSGDGDLPLLDAREVHEAIAQAPRWRPDLLALQAGFEAQDDRYRGALRAQFPAITVGPTRSRDTSNVNTVGVSLGIALPLFNRNQGNIAIESATRDMLHLEYQQRLDATASEAHRLLDAQSLLTQQLADIDASLSALAITTDRARRAFEANNIDALTLTAVEGALLARRLERITTAQALQEQAIALQALLGTPFNPAGHDARHPVEKAS